MVRRQPRSETQKASDTHTASQISQARIETDNFAPGGVTATYLSGEAVTRSSSSLTTSTGTRSYVTGYGGDSSSTTLTDSHTISFESTYTGEKKVSGTVSGNGS